MVREALTLDALEALELRDAAAILIARRSEGLTAGEHGLLKDWLAADRSHQQAFDSAESAWRQFDDGQDDEVLAAMRAHALVPRRRVAVGWHYAAAAALAVLIAGAVWFVTPALRPGGPTPQQVAANGQSVQYVSAHGAVKAFTLPDGSSMILDADSAAVGRFSADHRSIQLQHGRAFFAVAPDRSRPFSVAAADQQVVAVGTRFDVDLGGGGLTVTLLEGHVTVGPPARKAVLLEPGQQFVLRRGRAVVRTIGPQAEDAAAWRTGLIKFDDQTLAEAVAVMNRYSRDQIVIRDPATAAIRVSGQFRAGDTDRFARTLAEMHRLRFVRRTGEIELSPAN